MAVDWSFAGRHRRRRVRAFAAARLAAVEAWQREQREGRPPHPDVPRPASATDPTAPALFVDREEVGLRIALAQAEGFGGMYCYGTRREPDMAGGFIIGRARSVDSPAWILCKDGRWRRDATRHRIPAAEVDRP